MTALSYHRLSRTARDTIKWSGVSIVGYVRSRSLDGQWHGDRCGCSDDRCIGYHHDADEDCGCLPVLLAEYVRERP